MSKYGMGAGSVRSGNTWSIWGPREAKRHRSWRTTRRPDATKQRALAWLGAPSWQSVDATAESPDAARVSLAVGCANRLLYPVHTYVYMYIHRPRTYFVRVRGKCRPAPGGPLAAVRGLAGETQIDFGKGSKKNEGSRQLRSPTNPVPGGGGGWILGAVLPEWQLDGGKLAARTVCAQGAVFMYYTKYPYRGSESQATPRSAKGSQWQSLRESLSRGDHVPLLAQGLKKTLSRHVARLGEGGGWWHRSLWRTYNIKAAFDGQSHAGCLSVALAMPVPTAL